MLATLPPEPYSKARNSGSSSSQLASLLLAGFCFTGWLKSGARNGLLSWREITDCGTTCFSGATVGSGASVAMISWSGLNSAPDAISMSRRSLRAASETTASSARSAIREVSRAAVLARMVATPSSLLRVSARSASVNESSVLAWARSSRINSAMTWNLVRFDGPTLPRSAAPSISRTARASTGMRPTSSPGRERRFDVLRELERRCAVLPAALPCDWPERAMILLNRMVPLPPGNDCAASVDAPYRPVATQQDQRPADGRRFQTQASCDHG